MENSEERTRVESIFIRHRNVLMTRANFTDIYTDYYLHLSDHSIRYQADLDLKLKELLAALTLHTVARPWAETHAWTANLRAPRVNFFATASSTNENIVGRLFTKDVREPPQNLLYTQVSEKGREPRQSTVAVDSDEPFAWLEHFYLQSEQRPGKIFELPDENFVFLAAQPDYDEEWFDSLTVEAVSNLDDTEELSALETRFFHFHCGCNLARIMPALAVWRDKLDELFQGQDHVKIQCPRCAATFQVTPADFDKDDNNSTPSS